MDLAGLVNSILSAVESISIGRKGLATDGRERKGRISYEAGISGALTAFQEASNHRTEGSRFASTADPQTIVLAELTFLQQELQFCHEADTDTKSSLTQAIQSFDDALLSLEAVKDAASYKKIADKTFPPSPKYRIQGFPKDAFHLACIAHRTRLHNVLRSPGINMIEKAVLTQRAANMTAAQGSYIELQRKALG
jgi:hypothetical protein